MRQTRMLDLFAGIPVTDYAAARPWYERLLGAEPAFYPHDTEAVWELAEHRYLYIVQQPEHAGHARHTLFVTDLAARVTQIPARGLAPVAEETYTTGVRTITYRDPDGNEIGFGGAPLSPASDAGDTTERARLLAPFAVLIGTWATEAIHPLVDAVVPGSVRFEWVEGGHFLMQRSHNDDERFPGAIAIIGAPEVGDGLVMEDFDARGVRRTYGVSLADGVLRLWRDHPGFDQRFAATLAPDAFTGQWQLARTPGDGQDDLRVTYRRRDS